MAQDEQVEILRKKRELLLRERGIEDDDELRAAYPWPGRETWPQYFERTNGGTDDNIPHKSKVV
jgi:hypothetical protein